MILSYLKPFLIPDGYIIETDELKQRLRLLDLCGGFQLTQGSTEKNSNRGCILYLDSKADMFY